VSRGKKKKKITGQNLSLSERLKRNWEGEKWEAFVSLYMRDRAESDRGPWAARFHDALYNCLTAALFLHKNHAGARQIAEMMLSERCLDQDDSVMRMCARTALDFIDIREGRSSVPSLGEGLGVALPSPYGELSRKLLEEFAPQKRDRGKRETSNSSVEKLSKQFKALPSAKNVTPYTTFLKTAEILASETEGTDASEIFKAVRDIASLMRKIAGKECRAADLPHLISLASSGGGPLRASHPALLTLWEHMCKLGGSKFGGDWERAARVARMSLLDTNDEFRPAYDKLTALKEGFSSEELPLTAERYYSGLTEQERFIVIFLIIVEYAKKDINSLVDLPGRTLLMWFKTLGEIGSRRRSGEAWPAVIGIAFEGVTVTGEEEFINSISKEDLPFECMTVPTIVAMTLYRPHIIKRVRAKLGSRLPLRVDDRDERILDNFFLDIIFPHKSLEITSGLFGPIGREIFFNSAFLSIIRSEVSRALEDEDYRPMYWGSISQAHIALFAENLPEDSQAAAFCRLCLGEKHMKLSEDPSKIAAFFSSRLDEDPFKSSALSLFLITWPGISVEFLLRHFEKSLQEHEAANDWDAIPKIVSRVLDPGSKKKIAHGISLILKKRYKRKMSPVLSFVVKALGALEKGGKLPKDYDDRLDKSDDIDFEEDELIEMFARLFRGANRRG
jgi:hypothetical protein